jgi:hypothetical protein
LKKCNIWSQHNRLPSNINKYRVITLSHSQNHILYNSLINHTFPLGINYIRYLETIFESNMPFSLHINSFIYKSFKMIGFIDSKYKKFNNINTLKLLYLTLVRSHQEFVPIIWSPNYAVYINQVDNVQ